MNTPKDSTGGCCPPRPCSGLVVSLNHFEQYGPDGYENVIKTLIVSRETTVGEIIDWAQKVTGAEKTGWPFAGPVHLAASDIAPNKSDG
jgi:hypothetical protein